MISKQSVIQGLTDSYQRSETLAVIQFNLIKLLETGDDQYLQDSLTCLEEKKDFLTDLDKDKLTRICKAIKKEGWAKSEVDREAKVSDSGVEDKEAAEGTGKAEEGREDKAPEGVSPEVEKAKEEVSALLKCSQPEVYRQVLTWVLRMFEYPSEEGYRQKVIQIANEHKDRLTDEQKILIKSYLKLDCADFQIKQQMGGKEI